jgi:hypothetical protein
LSDTFESFDDLRDAGAAFLPMIAEAVARISAR